LDPLFGKVKGGPYGFGVKKLKSAGNAFKDLLGSRKMFLMVFKRF
jgi:hypothetical protein